MRANVDMIRNREISMRVEESYRINEKFIHALRALYDYESQSVNNQLSVGFDFNVEWTEQQLVDIVEESNGTREEALGLLKELEDSKRLVKFFDSEGNIRAYRTDTAELVRLSTFNYNRYPEKITNRLVSSQSGVTWDVEAKMTPKWEISISEVAAELRHEVTNGWMDENGNSHTYVQSELNDAITIVAAAYDAVQKKKFGTTGMLSGFQFRSVRSMLRGLYSTGNKTLAILAGTGSGKSYGFQIGTLISIVEQRLAGTLEKTHSIFLYPRVALMDDQRKSMENLLYYCNRALPSDKEIRWLTDGGSNLKKDYKAVIEPTISDSNYKKLSAPKMIKEFYGSKKKCPHLVFANADTITNRLTSHDAVIGLTSELRNIVFDEIHLLESITGANTSGVIRRLCAQAKNELMLTGSSATIADERDHLGKVFARKSTEVTVVKPAEEETELTGLIHHVFHKTLEGSSFKTNLVNLTSLVSHQRRRRATDPPESTEASHKTLGFADSLNLIGSWEFLLRDNEANEFRPNVMKKINSGLDASSLFPESMPLPYRFDKPLIKISEILDDMDVETTKSHCNSCISGTNSSILVSDASALKHIPLDPFRTDNNGILKQLYEGDLEVGVTDKCPYFECGACWREENDFKPVPLFEDGPIVYQNSIRPIRLTSQSIQEKKIEYGSESEIQHFSINLDEFHKIKKQLTQFGKEIEANNQLADIALSSPAIEVGMDFDNALDAVMFKAIRNISAYRQKVGRLGRERYRDVYSSMLTSFRAVDYHYYRNPAPLLSNDRLEPIALNVDNENVRKQIAYMAVYDDIAKYGDDIAQRLHNIRSHPTYSTVVEGALEYLNTNFELIAIRLQDGLKERNLDLCRESITKVIDHLNILMEDISPLLLGDDVNCLADRIGHKDKIHNANHRKGMQNLYLSTEGTTFLRSATGIDDYLREIALNRHYDTGENEFVTEGIELAVSIWDRFEKGLDDERLGTFLNDYVQKLVTVPFLDGLSMVFMRGVQEFNTLQTCSDYVKELIFSGRIPLARTFQDWSTERRKSKNFSIYYLRDLFSSLHCTKHDLPFVFQKTLFKPPNEKTVSVYVPKPSSNTTDSNETNTVDLPIGEVLFAHAPGMWNYRRASMPLKTSCYKQLQPTENNTHLNMPLNNVGGESIIKHQFVKRSKIRRRDIPWNFNLPDGINSIDLYEPEKINLRISRGLKGGNEVIKGLCWNDQYILIKDRDDTDEENFSQPEDAAEGGDEQEGGKDNINVPDCYPIGWRTISPLSSESIPPFNGPFEVEFQDDVLRKILFDKTEFCPSTHAQEFIIGNTRKYQGGGEVEIHYVDNKVSSKNAVIGHEYNTQGLRFVVSKNTLGIVSEWIQDQMSTGTGSHTQYQVLQYVLCKNLGVNRFVVDSIIRLALHKLEYRIPDLFEEWLETIRSLTLSDFSSFKQTCEGSTIKGISLDTLEYVVGKIVTDPSIVNRNHAELTIDWANRAYSNSLAIHMLQAAREFAGSRDEDLGYHVECDASHLDHDSEIVIWLYDRSPDGNGSCKTIKQWMQIPKIVKDEFETSNDRTLPTQDFVDCLEGSYLVPCSAHQADTIAYACYQNEIDPTNLRHGLSREFVFSHSNYASFWKRLEDEGYTKEKFTFVKLITPFLYSNRSEQEFFNRALEGCHTSCVECLEEFGISMFGPLDGPNFANKRLLNHVLTELMNQNPDDYRQTDVSIQGAADGIKGIGTFDPDDPLHVTYNGRKEIRFAMLHPVRMWSEIDTDNPFGIHNQIRSKFWTKMKIDRWSHGND